VVCADDGKKLPITNASNKVEFEMIWLFLVFRLDTMAPSPARLSPDTNSSRRPHTNVCANKS
jgi:hypothetical protein